MNAGDDDLMADLRRVAGLADPVPEPVRAAARAAFETRHMDARLAELVADSAAEADFEPVRQAADERLLSFQAEGTQVELTVRAEGAGWTMMGQVFGEGSDAGTDAGTVIASASVDSGTRGSTPLALDALGRFMVTDLASGPTRVRCRLPGGGSLVTSWVML